MAPETEAKLNEFEDVRIDRNGFKTPTIRPGTNRIFESQSLSELAMQETLEGLTRVWSNPLFKLSSEDIENNRNNFIKTQSTADADLRNFALSAAMKISRLGVRFSTDSEDKAAFEAHPASRSVVMEAGYVYSIPDQSNQF